MADDDDERSHISMRILGLRATSTAAGLFSLCHELVRAGVLDDAAVGRIKDSMVKELCFMRPASATKHDFERSIRQRLDGLFAGTEKLSDAPREPN